MNQGRSEDEEGGEEEKEKIQEMLRSLTQWVNGGATVHRKSGRD